jgi:Domain of unknown function (DUF4845)
LDSAATNTGNNQMKKTMYGALFSTAPITAPANFKSPLKGPSRQKGMTGIALALILAMVGVFALLALRLFPIYMEHFNVTSHLNRLAEDSNVKTMTDKAVISTLQKRFTIDDVKNVTREHIFIEREKGKVILIAIEYEVRTKALGNIDMVVNFVDEVKL